MAIQHSLYRIDAPGKVTGATQYPGDLMPDDLLHAKIVFSGQPHARMRVMDSSRAEAVPGVVAIFTAADVPSNEYGLVTPDQPVLVGLNNDRPHSEISLWEGDQIAIIIAETEAAAERARDLIDVEWEQLPIVENMFDALKDEVVLHRAHGTNLINSHKIRKGEMAQGWAEADVVVEGEYFVPYQEHAYLQPEAGISYIDAEGRVTIEVAGQWAHEDRLQIAHALKLPKEQIRVIYPAIGGAFGGREDTSIQIVMALAAWRLSQQGINRPIKTVWTREESIIGHHKRHPMHVKTKWGATRDGQITAMEATVILDGGAYNCTSSEVLGNAHFSIGGPYKIPHAHVDSYAVYTSNVPCGAFRGFGAPQSTFVAEMQINKLAEAVGLDPVAFRLKNVLREGDLTITQTPITPGVSIAEVVQACASAITSDNTEIPKYRNTVFTPVRTLPPNPQALRRGRGMACTFKNVGYSFGFPERCEATIELYGAGEIERAVLRHAGADLGQGAHTVFKQMAAEAVGIGVENVELILSDTAQTGDSGSSSASRMTYMAGHAIRGATERALALWQDEERPATGHFRYTPPTTEPFDAETGRSYPHFAYGYVAEAVELTVDIDTGHINVERVVCANDVGNALNPQILEGQIEGAVVQAHGYTVTENLQVRDGFIQNPRFSSYLIPGIMDIPQQVDSLLLEIPDPHGPWGARGWPRCR